MNKEIQTANASVSIYKDPYNKRIRVDDYDGDVDEVLVIISQMISGWVEKLIVKSRTKDLAFFLSQGFLEEAHVKGYFSGQDMHFVVKYYSAERKLSKKWHEEQQIIESLTNLNEGSKIEKPVQISFASPVDAVDLAKLYAEIFLVYPTPVTDPDYIQKNMGAGTIYAYIKELGKIVSAASAEINRKYKNAELTDCATQKHAQGKGYMKKLLLALEERLITEGIKCLYTLARAESVGMNKAFFELGYTYSGRLVNNCNIYSGIEDMNVWWKSEFKAESEKL